MKRPYVSIEDFAYWLSLCRDGTVPPDVLHCMLKEEVEAKHYWAVSFLRLVDAFFSGRESCAIADYQWLLDCVLLDIEQTFRGNF